MEEVFTKAIDGLLKVVYGIGRSTVLAISRYTAYQPEEDGELFEMIYQDEK